MTKAGWLDEKPVRPCLAQQPPQANLKRHAVDTAQAPPCNLADSDTVLVAA
ncbi:hypothetical protein D3C76_1759260 [compost metagenome]